MIIKESLEEHARRRAMPLDFEPLPDGWPPGKWIYNSIENFLLRNGRYFTPCQRPANLKRMQAKQCYDNAFKLAKRKGLIYVEGIALAPGINHAWCVDDDGIVIDPTWDWDNVDEYFGVAFDLEFVVTTRRAIKTHSVLDNPSQGFPLLRSESDEWRHKGEIAL